MDVPAGAKTVVYDVYLVDHQGNYIPGTAGKWKYYGEGFEENKYAVDSWVADEVAEGGVRAIMLESSVVATEPAASPTANVRSVSSDDNGVAVRTDFGESEGAGFTSYAEVVVYDERGRERSRWGAVPIAPVTQARAAGVASNHALTPGTSDLRVIDATSRTESQIRKGIENGSVKVEINPPRNGRPSR
jgi:hypothetical protein